MLRAVVNKYADGLSDRLRSIEGRFTKRAFSGETLVTSMWRESGRVLFQTKVKERDLIVIDHGVAVVWDADLPEDARPSLKYVMRQSLVLNLCLTRPIYCRLFLVIVVKAVPPRCLLRWIPRLHRWHRQRYRQKHPR